MEIKKQFNQFMDRIKKFRIPALVLLIGLCLMLIPTGKQEEPVLEEMEVKDETASMELRLERILSRIEGVGDVSVLLSVEVGEEQVYQTDSDYSINGESETNRQTTVIVDEKNDQETPLVKKVIFPRYSGAVVVCHGADSAGVRLAVVDAVSKIAGLGADRISVLKMK